MIGYVACAFINNRCRSFTWGKREKNPGKTAAVGLTYTLFLHSIRKRRCRTLFNLKCKNATFACWPSDWLVARLLKLLITVDKLKTCGKTTDCVLVIHKTSKHRAQEQAGDPYYTETAWFVVSIIFQDFIISDRWSSLVSSFQRTFRSFTMIALWCVLQSITKNLNPLL